MASLYFSFGFWNRDSKRMKSPLHPTNQAITKSNQENIPTNRDSDFRLFPSWKQLCRKAEKETPFGLNKTPFYFCEMAFHSTKTAFQNAELAFQITEIGNLNGIFVVHFRHFEVHFSVANIPSAPFNKSLSYIQTN